MTGATRGRIRLLELDKVPCGRDKTGRGRRREWRESNLAAVVVAEAEEMILDLTLRPVACPAAGAGAAYPQGTLPKVHYLGALDSVSVASIDRR